MGKIDVGLAVAQASRLRAYADTLRGIKGELGNIGGSLSHSWQAEEMVFVQNAINKINIEISNVSSELMSLGSSIQAAAYEIRREEEAAEAAARAKAEAEARARAEAEAKAKARAEAARAR